MLHFINEILMAFSICFTRTAAFQWFVILVTGLMLRSDRLGATSVIRDLCLRHGCYEAMMHFFRSDAWSLDRIVQCWHGIVAAHAPLYRENGNAVLVGDGVKHPKEGRFMPGVKRLHQESENSSKPQYIFGHLFGGIGVLAGSASKLFCIPLRFNIQDGLRETAGWDGSIASTESHVVQVILNAWNAAQAFGNSLLLLDRYFLTVPALKMANELNGTGKHTIALVTKAKRSCVAYRHPVRKHGRGRPPVKGAAVKLADLFDSEKGRFSKVEMPLYGKMETVHFHAVDLLWGKKLYQELRFVLVEYSGKRSILASTDLQLDARTIISLYCKRFKIECTFREFKQQIGGFSYRFWSHAAPKLNRFRKKDDPLPLETVLDGHERRLILKTVRATECFVQLSTIAMGILQMVSLKWEGRIPKGALRYQRTPSKPAVSEATLMDYLRRNIFRLLANAPQLAMVRIIRRQQKESAFCEDAWAC